MILRLFYPAPFYVHLLLQGVEQLVPLDVGRGGTVRLAPIIKAPGRDELGHGLFDISRVSVDDDRFPISLFRHNQGADCSLELGRLVGRQSLGEREGVRGGGGREKGAG